MTFARPRSSIPLLTALLGTLVLVGPLSPAVAWASPVSDPLPQLQGAPDLSVSPIPSALQLPWAARTGFDPARMGEVTQVSPSNGTVAVTVTLWPSSPTFFASPTTASRATMAQLADRYGLATDKYNALAGYFQSQGLTVIHTWPDRLSISLSGPSGAVESAFGTRLGHGQWHGHPVQFPESVPRLPDAFASEVSAVSGLDSGFSTFTIPFAPAPSPSLTTSGPVPSAVRTTKFITPSTIHKIYGLDGLYNYSGSSHWATGLGIALVLWGDGYSPNDIQNFYSNYYPGGFPPVQIVGYPIDGAPPPAASAVSDPSGAAQELTLDIEWSGSEAPGATLYAVYAPDGPASNSYSPSDAAMEDALNTAINLPTVRAVSMSFGTPDGSDPSFQAAFATSFADAQRLGVTVLAASGDNGGTAKGNCQGGTSPQFPAASPSVLAVGGTAPVLALDAVGQVTGIESEPAWNLSGGGFSTGYSAPSWQKVGSAAAPIRASGHRGIPDVAGPSAYNFFYFNGQSAAGKGTSFATPMWAGLIVEMDAVSNLPFGFATPRLYQVAASAEAGSAAKGFVDVTDGANCLGPAKTGWDTATGWGSPNALLLFQDLSFSFVKLLLSTSSSAVAPGGTVDATVQVLNSSSHRPIPRLPVDFSLDAIGRVGLCTGTLSTGNISTDPNGTATVTLSVPGCYFGSKVSVTSSVSSFGYFGTNSTTLTVNLLGLAGFLAIVQVYPYNILAFVVIMTVATLLGMQIGAWRHRRAARRTATPPPAPPSAATEPPLPNPTGPGPSATEAPIGPPPTDLGSTPPDVPGRGVPAHVVEPPPR